MSQKVKKTQKEDIRELIFGTPGPNFQDETQLEVARVWCYYEKHGNTDNPSDVLEQVSKKYQDHWRNLGKEVQNLKVVKEKVNFLVKKLKSLDSSTYILKDPAKHVPKQKAKFQRIVNIDLNQKKSKAAKVILEWK